MPFIHENYGIRYTKHSFQKGKWIITPRNEDFSCGRWFRQFYYINEIVA
jgi:hypothetical protein